MSVRGDVKLTYRLPEDLDVRKTAVELARQVAQETDWLDFEQVGTLTALVFVRGLSGLSEGMLITRGIADAEGVAFGELNGLVWPRLVAAEIVRLERWRAGRWEPLEG